MLVVSSFNIKNDYFKYNKEKTNTIIDYLIDNKIDILTLQELYKKADKDLTKYLLDLDYHIIKRYRFISRLILRPINESTPIITNRKIISKRNYRLPFLPSFPKRIMTKIVIEYNNELISIYNTHLDNRNVNVQEKELKKISKILEKDKNKIILTGDFNLKINKGIFISFIKRLSKLNIVRVEIDEKTLKQSKYNRAIDHIFVSKELKVIDKKVIKDLEISDHYPILIKIA